MFSDDEMVGAELLGRHHVRVRTFSNDRVCAHEACRTRLSIYNGGLYCSVHDFRVEPLRGLHVHEPPAEPVRGAPFVRAA